MVESHSSLSALVFTGTMKGLLEKLNDHKQDSSAWPKTPRGLGDVLRRQQPALSSLGIDIEIGKPGRNGITVEIKKREHRERCERGLEDLPAKRKVLIPDSVANNDVELF
jgi:hypothetical protein